MRLPTLVYIFAFIGLSRSSISVRLGNRIIYDSPLEPFGLTGDGSGTGFGLQERALCSATRSLPIPSDLDGPIAQRALAAQEDDWSKTVLRSYTQTYRDIPFYGSSIVLSYDTEAHKYERRDMHGLKYVSIVEAEHLYAVRKMTSEECLSVCQQRFNETGPVNYVNYEDYYYTDQTEGGKLKYIKKVVYRVDGGYDTACLVDTKLPGQVLRSWRENYAATVSVDSVGGNLETGEYEYGAEGSGSKYPQLQVDQPNSEIRQCTMTHGQIATYSGCSATSPFSFGCDDGTGDATSEAYSPLSDCHFFADKFQSFITDTMGISPWYPGTSSAVKIVVKTLSDCNAITNICTPSDVAKYYPSLNMVVASNGCPVYKDFYHTCSCPDVIGHELGHAVTSKYSNLEYGQGGMSNPDSSPAYTEAACINEAFSDIIGIAFEYALEGTTDYLVGDRCTKGSKPIRSLISAADSYSPGIDNMKNIFSTTGVESHIGAGIFGHAYYVLAKTSGWTPVSAAKPFTLANQCYWRHTITMREAACSVLNAATTLYGSTAAPDVTAAFESVGISDLCVTSTTTLTDCQTSTVAAASTRIGDLINFQYTVPTALSGQPNTYLLVVMSPSYYGVIWRSGTSAPNFDANENPNLIGYGGPLNQYYVTSAPSGTITFAGYVTEQPTQPMTLNVCGYASKVYVGTLSTSTTDGSVTSCAPSITGLTWTVTSQVSLFVVKVSVPQTGFSHFKYQFSMVVKNPPTSDVTDVAIIKIFIGLNKIVIDKTKAVFYQQLDPTYNYAIEKAQLGASSDTSAAGDYYIALLGYLDSVSVSSGSFAGITMTVCDVADETDFDVLYFDFSSLVKFPNASLLGIISNAPLTVIPPRFILIAQSFVLLWCFSNLF